MLKIALLHFCFEDYTIELANSLVKYVDLTLIHPETVSAVCRNNLDSRIRTISFPKPRIRDPRNLLSMAAMMRIIKELKPDVLHVQETNDPWYDLTLFLNKMPPLVTTIHDVFRHPGDRQSVFGSEYTKRIAFKRSQQLIVHTQSLKDALTKNFQVSQQQVNIIPHGELGSLYQRRSGKNNVAREPYTLLFFGRIWPYKGLKYLIEAMPLIAAKIPEVKLIIAGRGENIEQYFPSGYDSTRIELLNDFIPLEQVAGLFQRSTISVLPYIEASQSGVAALSYGMGTPIVASDIGGLSEIVQHQKDGFLVPPGDVQALADAIINLLSDRNLQHQMQTAALARSQQDLNWSNIAEKTIETYHTAIKMEKVM
ncbi:MULTISPECIES: glycosyltransferase family 4 protein [unclassified Anabaena]|uniref:glycosyltransferase family 4 protein n=1 Tax=unclassified Anabaena TaxID=2619674 RepID=UPI00144604C5|nr:MULTISPECIES: glycosyltransferase family 4 protein [unclassified Anabaena]MTJ08758.1 glycosyltransferase family 4 protein [Anabaena sp. UHCC 0204]MTJ53068.1 glycosyltransferase family 4 protein [Anabaena sp. UHCC 0253]